MFFLSEDVFQSSLFGSSTGTDGLGDGFDVGRLIIHSDEKRDLNVGPHIVLADQSSAALAPEIAKTD